MTASPNPSRQPIRHLSYTVHPWIERASSHLTYGVLVMRHDGSIVYASTIARRWSRAVFEKWFERRSPTFLARRVRTRTLAFESGRTFVVTRLIPDRAHYVVLLEERERATTEPLMSSDLTRREREVLGWVGVGKTNPETAAILGISPKTVTKHLEHVYTKLGVETRTAAVAAARSRPSSLLASRRRQRTGKA